MFKDRIAVGQIFAPRHPLKIVGMVVSPVAILVINFVLWCWAVAKKSLGHKDMHPHGAPCIIYAYASGEVPAHRIQSHNPPLPILPAGKPTLI